MKRRDVGSRTERNVEGQRESERREQGEWETREGALPVGSVEKADRGGYGVVVVVVVVAVVVVVMVLVAVIVWVRGGTGSSVGREGARGAGDERSRGMERDERWEMEGSLGDRPRGETNTEVGGRGERRISRREGDGVIEVE